MAAAAPTEEGDEQRVLVLNSYHPEYQWTSELVRGIREGLSDVIEPESFHTEFMDGRRFVDDEIFRAQLIDLLSHKYAVFRPDVVIATDDYAFRFMLEHGERILPGVPHLFCGVNVLEPELLRGRTGVAGIAEGMEIAGNVELILDVHPQTRRIVVLADQTSFGQRMVERAREVAQERAASPTARAVELEVWDDITISELLRAVEDLDSDTVLLMLAIHVDPEGNYFSFAEHLPLLSERSTVPIYGMWGALLLGNGILGGMLNDPHLHGMNVAKLAERVLAGEEVDTIGVIPKALYRPFFDYSMMQRFGVRDGDIPEGAVVAFRPETFYSQHRTLVWSTLAAFIGLLLVILVLATTIQARKRAQEQLHASEERFRTTFEQAVDGLLLLDPGDGSIIEFNRAAHEVLGYSREEFARMKVSDLAPAFLSRTAPGESTSFETKLPAKHGEPLTFEVRVRPITIHGREFLLSLHRNVTQQRMLEEQLRQSQKMEAIGKLAGGVAHDFNNLLTGVLCNCEMLDGKLTSDETREAIAEIRRCGERAARLTRQLLTFSRKEVTRPEIVDLHGVAAGLKSMLERTVGEHVHLTWRRTAGEAWVEADPTHLEQVIMNLVINARDAMLGGGRVRVETSTGWAEASHVLCVSDDGIGMDENTREHIFEPFFTTKDRSKGTGLGLSTVYGIVSMIGGTIAVESEPGVGTTFRVELPPVRGYVPAPKESGQRATPLGARCGTILVVDDDEMVLHLVGRSLRSAGYDVIEANRSATALDSCGRGAAPIDLLLTDVVMPECDGPALAEQVRARQPDARVLFMSGYSGESSRAIGSASLLRKPFSMRQLVDAVDAELGNAATPSRTTSASHENELG